MGGIYSIQNDLNIIYVIGGLNMRDAPNLKLGKNGDALNGLCQLSQPHREPHRGITIALYQKCMLKYVSKAYTAKRDGGSVESDDEWVINGA